jgi:hypothetical protein
MSLPCINWLSFGREAIFPGALLAAIAIFLLILFYGWRSRLLTKKPTTVASRGFLSESISGATSPGGVAVRYDDHDQTNLDQQRNS